jgi:hypothetical protein
MGSARTVAVAPWTGHRGSAPCCVGRHSGRLLAPLDDRPDDDAKDDVTAVDAL